MTMPFRRTISPERGRDFSQWFWPRGLLLLSIAVLAAPLALWGAFWLRTPWNVAMVVVLGAALWALYQGQNDAIPDVQTRRELRATAWWTFVPLALMCFGSGIGGWGYQTGDWKKHNAVLADLVRFEWPVRYSGAPNAVHLTYYTAFYLPAAFVGKIFGWTAALVAHQLGALVVIGLLSAWLAWIVGPRVRWVGVLFATFGGLDYLAAFLGSVSHGGGFQFKILSREWWEHPVPWWAYYAHATELFWVPHTALAGWLGSAILLRATSPLVGANEGNSSGNWNDLSFDLVACALLPLWSPWAWLGCLVLLGVRVAQHRRAGRALVLWPWLFMAAMWIMQFGYLMSRVALPSGVSGGLGYRPTFTAPAFIGEFGGRYFGSYLAFSLVEFGVYVLLCLWLWRRARGASPLASFLWPSVAMLLLLPLFQYGLYNDLLRSAVTPLVVVCLTCASALRVAAPRSALGKTVLVGALCIGALHSVQCALYFAHAEKAGGLLHLPRLEKTPSVYDLYAHDRRRQLLTQYIGRDDSPWARWFLKP